ncbi:MAG TPA: BTAD domain-containing putative transcriptional regulator, partial [Chloroflexia bacterium]|nr:BTAD domain-containing putative transcriptional regulator [Chloroflexia bacterium]
MSLHISLLGHFALIANGHPLFPVLPPRLVELIACLVLFAVQEQPRRNVAFMLWPDTTEAQAQANLRKLLYQLRAELPPVAAHVQATARHLKWEAGAAVSCDVHTFDAALTAAHKAATGRDLAGEYAELQAATAAYGGDLLPGHEAEWLLAPRERLRRSYIAALGRLIDLLESRREYAAAVDVARRLVETDPLHEASYRILMRLHASNGDRASALHVYHTCATVLQRELGISPSPSTQVAYQDLLAATAPEAVQVSALPSKIVEPGLVGRRGEWARLQEAWSSARSGRASLTLLVGEGGIGKTRLAEEFHAWALRQGLTTAAARCYATEEGLAYAPVITWLRALRGVLLPAPWQQELGRLLPEFAEGAPRPADYGDEGGQQRLFEALARAVLAVQPCLLIVDDLQWCDQATLVWLHYLLRFDPRAQLLVLGTVRPEEVGDAHQLHPLLSSLQKEHRLWEIPLGPLNQDETVHLASAVAAQEIGPQRAARLYQESEGNPLLIVEMMRAELDPAPQTLYAGWG